MSRHLLFVYGTLRRGGVNEVAKSYPNASFIGGSSFRGRLYDMGGYPAIVPDESAGPVAGEVYEIDDTALAALDEFEEADEYRREKIEIVLNGKTTQCWMYRPRPELCAGKPSVEAGDWIEYAKARA